MGDENQTLIPPPSSLNIEVDDMRRIRIFCVMAAAFTAMSAGMASAQAWKPAMNVEIAVASGAGGA